MTNPPKKLVFVIEDDHAQQRMLQFHFEEALGAYAVRSFLDPEKMLASLSEKPFAIVLDHFFSNKSNDGIHYLRLLKKKHPSIPVIYYTTLDDNEVRAQALKIGAEQYIVKDAASLVRLRTTLDNIHEKKNKKGFLRKLFKG